MPNELKGWVRPRPLRVAFLIEDGEHANLMLDGIFADCYDRWGGRFSLIVPAVNGRIAPSYWEWLEAYDPDIVYSYVPLSRADVLEIHERLYPARYRFHPLRREPQLNVFDYKPSFELSPLSSLSVVFRLARYNPTAVSRTRIQVIDSWYTEQPSRFLTDNFGTYHRSRGTGIYPADAMAEANLLTVVAPEKQANPKLGIPRDLIAVPDELHALREFADRRATSLSILSSFLAPRLEITDRRSGSFNLVVGDSFTDRLVFWNVRLLIPAWLDRDICAARVSLDRLAQPDFLDVLGTLLKNRNHVNAGGGGQPRLTIRSSSLSTAQLTEAHRLLASTGVWGAVSTELINSMDEIVPSGPSLKTAREGDHYTGSIVSKPDWKRFVWSPPIVRPPEIIPDHLSDAPVRQAFTTGFWCADFLLERESPGPMFSEQNLWVLPRRWRMVDAFKISYALEPHRGNGRLARRSRAGNLSVFVSFDHPIESIEVPSPNKAVAYALARDGLMVAPDAEGERAYPPNKVAWTSPSNEARYLTGVLGMTGGSENAARFLLHPFLQGMFGRLGATPRLDTNMVTPTVNRLAKRAINNPLFNLRDERERSALGELIVKAARGLRKPADFVTYEDLKALWKAHRQAYWANRGHERGGDPEINWDDLEQKTLDDCLIEMRSRQMMFQGHSWTCRNCHHRNWVNLDRLTSRLSCEVCHQSAQAPVSINWLFRPNDFLIESLRDHSILSLVWVLDALRLRSRRSLIFIEPTKFGFDQNSDKSDAEADLLVLLDGKAIACEVKSSWRGLRSTDVSDFVALATRIRPDCALLAVMEEGPPGLVAELAAARAHLVAEKIDFEVLTLNEYRPRDDPYLTS